METLDSITAKTEATETLAFLEKDQSIQIHVSIPKKFIVRNIESADEVYRKILALSPDIDTLAKHAFINNDKQSWDTIQALMYYWNYRDLMRIDRIKDNSILVEYALRKIVLDAYIKNSPEHKLECENSFTPERAVQELSNTAFSHRINTHPLLEEMKKNGLNKQATRKFLENYYVNNRLFHLFIAALNFCAPLKRRTELANNFYDEMGSGDSHMAHPELFLKNFDTIGKPDIIIPTPEALFLANTKSYTAFLCGDYHFGMGGFGYIELTMPNQMRKILSGLGKSGLSRPDLEFWETHITIDLEHGKTWFSEMLCLIETPEHAKKCLAGGIRLLDARATMYDGIMNYL